MRTQRTGNFRLTNDILKPRHVFIFFINNENLDNQLKNPFLYNTFNITNNVNNTTLEQCYLELGNGNEYPRIKYEPRLDPSRVFQE